MSKNFLIESALPKQQWRIPGLLNLSETIEVNGTAKTPHFLYLGHDAIVASWEPRTGGATLANSNTGANPTPDQPGPFNNLRGVLLNDGDYYVDGGTSAGNITTEDIIGEFVIETGSSVITNNQFFCNKYSGFGSYWACLVEKIGGEHGVFTARINGGGGAVDISSNALAANTLYHAMCILDRSGSGVWYVNNIASSPVDISGSSGSLTTGTSFCLGGAAAGAGGSTNITMHYAAMWIHSAWLNSHLQPALVNERFNAVTGGTGTMNVIR